MKIIKETINIAALDYTTINELIDISISKSNGPIFKLEDESIVVFMDQEQIYRLLTDNSNIYSPHSNEFDVDNFESFLVNTDDAEVRFLNEDINTIEEYEYGGMPVYRFIVE